MDNGLLTRIIVASQGRSQTSIASQKESHYVASQGIRKLLRGSRQ